METKNFFVFILLLYFPTLFWKKQPFYILTYTSVSWIVERIETEAPASPKN